MEQQKETEEQAKDVWTGKPEWDRIFSAWNIINALLLIFVVFLILKYVVPQVNKLLKSK